MVVVFSTITLRITQILCINEVKSLTHLVPQKGICFHQMDLTSDHDTCVHVPFITVDYFQFSFYPPFFLLNIKTIFNMYAQFDMIMLNLLIMIVIACIHLLSFDLFMLLMYLYGEGLVSCKNLFPIQLYIYIQVLTIKSL